MQFRLYLERIKKSTLDVEEAAHVQVFVSVKVSLLIIT